MADKKRTCEECGTALKGRADKRFCSAQCRSMRHNSRKADDNGELMMRRINSSLRKNRGILHKASPQGKTTIRRQVLELAGFDFRYITHQFRTHKGNVYNFCYDYGYLLLPEDKMLIVNWQPCMDNRSQPYP